MVMKKIIIGIIIGMALTLSSTALADQVTTLIGKKIANEYPVFVDGKELEKKAIVVNGSSYLPVRLMGDTVGYRVTFDPEGEVLLQKDEPIVTITDNGYKPSLDPEIRKRLLKQLPIQNVESEIIELENKLQFNDLYIHDLKGEKKEQIQAEIDVLRSQIAELKARKAELETQTTNP